MKITLLAALAACAFAAAAAARPLPQTPAEQFEIQLDLIQAFSHASPPYTDVVLTAGEANAYFAGPGAAKLPRGVSHLLLAASPGQIAGTAQIDFDQLGTSGNPLLVLFAGHHTVAAVAHVDSGNAPAARLTVTQVSLDGQVIPNALVDLALRAFVQPKHPAIGRSFKVSLPSPAVRAEAGPGEVTLHYPDRH